MSRAIGKPAANVGVTESGNCAVLVTVTTRGELLDRRQVGLTQGLPTHPYHHEGSWAVGRYLNSPWARPISLAEAIALIEEVERAAQRGAREALAALSKVVTLPIASIALRQCPELPPTIEERIRDNRAQAAADSVMYRQALAQAARERGWAVRWYDRAHVMATAAGALGHTRIDELLGAMGRAAGAPWQAKHKLAATAALACAAPR